ncbi:MAG: hypothetical protein WCH75_19685 [Candidatus Binatia bacterium]
MRRFTASDFLTLWERGAGLHAIDRALLILCSAMPEADGAEMVRWPLGARDRRLLRVRQENFGDCLDAYADCPACHERLEFSLSCAALLAATHGKEATLKSVDIDGAYFELRCPDSADAAAVAAGSSVEAGVKIMLARCVRVTEDGALTPARRVAIAAELAALDPAAEILLDLSCAACGHAWQTVFDIAHFLWSEILARARRLLQEVDALARAYHWNEAEILGMSEARRGLYLEMALS